ncbi:MAG: UDP-N-acetylmuramoyl-L-alanine--D-glutamate ligase [Clostridiales bacterium]|nr:UDP-N-acetylmuramoyl-L-alanine--D-glutamate ligase [Clostridiales bacterium]
MNFKGKKVLIVGMARSGISAAILLKKLGACVIVSDSKTEDKISDEVLMLKAYDISLYLGKNPDDIIKEQDLIILSPGVPSDLPFISEAEKNNIVVWSEVELGYRLCPCPVIAITGTNGKTTTTSLVGEIFRNYKKNTEVVGNIGIPFTEKVLSLDDRSFAVAEISSFQLEKIDKFKPFVSAILNITPDHLNRHKTLENYILTKARIFENQNENNYLILNYDDSVCRRMKNSARCETLYFTESDSLEKIGLSEGVYSNQESIFIKFREYNQKVIDISELKILGRHNVQNAMAAVGISLAAGVPMSVIINTLKNFKAVEHRIEYVTTINDIEFYNDSKGTNPDAAINAINAMKRPICLIGGGYDKKSDFDKWIKTFAGKVKYFAVIGEVSDKIISTCEKYGFKNYKKANSLEDAVKMCFQNAEEGDCILLSPACASWDMFESYEERGNLFKKFSCELQNKY